MKDPYYSQRLRTSKKIRETQRRIRPLSEEIESACRLLLWTIGGMLLILTVSFLYVSSRQSVKGYHLKQLQLDNEKLLIQNRELQGDLNQAQSIKNLDDDEKVREMTSPQEDDLSYIGPKTDLARQ